MSRYITFFSIIFLLISVFIFETAQALPTCVDGQVGGTVFRDFNYNGTRDTYEPGVPGVVVTAYNADGSEAGSATTADSATSKGEYTLNISSGSQIRLEFTGIPTYLFDGVIGTNSATRVNWIQSDGSCSHDLALTNPNQYCQSNPDIVTPCYVIGRPDTNSVSGNLPWLVKFPYLRTGQYESPDQLNPTPPFAPGTQWTSPTEIARGSEIGAVWGLGYDRKRSLVFGAAFLKNHVGYGPLGSGGIYAVNVSGTIGSNVTPWFSLETLFPGSAGADSHTALTNDGIFNGDDTGDDVGKRSLAGVDVSYDSSYLWVVAAFDRKLYQIPLANYPSVPTAQDIKVHDLVATLPSLGVNCANGDFRPFGLRVHPDSGKVFIGGICSAEANATIGDINKTCQFGEGTGDPDLKAVVLSHDPNGATGNLTKEIDFSLDYRKPDTFYLGVPPANLNIDGCYWRPWRKEMAFSWERYPHPMLTDIEFDSFDGSMVLNFADRLGHQRQGNSSSVPTTPITGGDILRVCNVSGTWVLESNGSCPNGSTSAASASNFGPNGGHFYYDVKYFRTEGANIRGHGSLSQGALVSIPGTGEVMASMTDPSTYVVFDFTSQTYNQTNDSDPFYAGGVIRLNNSTGSAGGSATEPRNAYTIYDDLMGSYFLSKAAGLGDLEAVCNLPPIQIGNLVFMDTDGNGVQDPDEMPISGVTVNLYDGSENLLGTVLTDSEGKYVFGGPSNLNLTSGSLQPNTAYTVKLNNQADYESGGPLYNKPLTLANSGTGSFSDGNDSDGIEENGYPVISFTTSGYGENNHTLDFGFTLQSQSMGTDQIAMDGGGNRMSNLVALAAAYHLKHNGKSCSSMSRRSISKSRRSAKALYLSMWSKIWALPATTVVLPSSTVPSGCVSTDMSEQLTEIQELASEIKTKFNSLASSCKNSSKIRSWQKKLSEYLKVINETDYPSVVVSCS